MKAIVEYGLIGEKIGMTRIFTPDGLVVPVTVLQCGPCYVVQEKGHGPGRVQSVAAWV